MSFSLILNSLQGTATTVGSSTSVGFNFNWLVLEDNSPYELSFIYQSKDAGALVANSHKQIRLAGIGGLNNSYNVTSAGVATSTEVIGLVYPVAVGATYFFFAGTETNPPVYFKSRPSGNNFKVEILNFDNGIAVGNYEWTLILHFKKL
jgi:hypothetical protein